MIGTIVGSYEILQEIGHGGMGTVYLGRHQMLGRLAAVKVLLPELSANEEMVSRILNEARLAGLIHHPGIVDVYEFGRLESGSAYLIMEYLEGETLGDLIDRSGQLELDLAVAITRQIAQAVGAAHSKDIIHRDLKPDNVFLLRDEEVACGIRVRILDFGIAKLANSLEGNSYRTRTGNLMGTPIYMSPEQCRGAGKVDWRSDIYALGCLLYEMLTARVPFDLEGTGEIIAAQLYAEAPHPSATRPGLPPFIDNVVGRLLAKRPDDRPQTMDEVVQLLGGRARSLPPTPPPDPERKPRVSTTFRSSVGEIATPPLPRRYLVKRALIAAGSVAVIGAVALGIMATRSVEPAVQPAAAPAVAPPLPPTMVTVPVPMPTMPAMALPVVTPDAGVAAEAPSKISVEPPARPPRRHPKKPTTTKPRGETLDPFGE